jgi:hypothetical protein
MLAGATIVVTIPIGMSAFHLNNINNLQKNKKEG